MQYEVRRGDEHDVAGVRIEGVLARTQRFFPDAALAFGDPFAMTERRPRQIASRFAKVTDDDADVTDRHDRLGMHLYGREPAIDEVGAVGQGLILPAAA